VACCHTNSIEEFGINLVHFMPTAIIPEFALRQPHQIFRRLYVGPYTAMFIQLKGEHHPQMQCCFQEGITEVDDDWGFFAMHKINK
jgi:hypothetical protein